jgi:hypothetical protein
MTKLEEEVIRRTMGSTMNIVDRHKCLAALAYAEKRCCKISALRMYLDMRKEWVDWHVISQRKWQMETKNKNKARHHDSISIREKYVRCNEITGRWGR